MTQALNLIQKRTTHRAEPYLVTSMSSRRKSIDAVPPGFSGMTDVQLFFTSHLMLRHTLGVRLQFIFLG